MPDPSDPAATPTPDAPCAPPTSAPEDAELAPHPVPELPVSPSAGPAPDVYAAVDLGSNSFHLLVARMDRGTLQVIDRYKEMVRLGEGLTAEKFLRQEVAERALACLERMGQRLRGVDPARIRAVGTNTLRQLRPEARFVEHAELALGHPIEVIAGREEARLVYLGVAHGLAVGDERRLVVDIGGGSTELIVGQGFAPLLRESLHMGCVSLTQRFFTNDKITARAMDQAELYGAVELRPVRTLFTRAGWQSAVGSSGTIKAIADVVFAEGWSEDGITSEALSRLREAILSRGRVSALDFKGLSEQRRPVFAGGLAVLMAVFKNLGVARMRASDQALREGLIYEMVGRSTQHEDVRERTVATLSRRFDIDPEQAARVRDSALGLLAQVAAPWGLTSPELTRVLGWAADLHEIGLAVAHTQYQKHGAYLLAHADLSGFTRQEQDVLAALVAGHRRKFPLDAFLQLPRDMRDPARRLCVLLRLACLMHRARAGDGPRPVVRVAGDILELCFPEGWLEQHPLTRQELAGEADRLASAGITLGVC